MKCWYNEFVNAQILDGEQTTSLQVFTDNYPWKAFAGYCHMESAAAITGYCKISISNKKTHFICRHVPSLVDLAETGRGGRTSFFVFVCLFF